MSALTTPSNGLLIGALPRSTVNQRRTQPASARGDGTTQPLQAVEALRQVVEAGLYPHVFLLLVRDRGRFLQRRRARDEGRGDRGGDDRDESDSLQHHEGGDDPTGEVPRRDVAVADR